MPSAVRPIGGVPRLSLIQGGLATVAARPAGEEFGRLIRLGATDGEHRLGSAHAVRVFQGPGRFPERPGERAGEGRQLEALFRLTEHYGEWLGYRAPSRSVGVGRVEILSNLPERADRIEYRIHIRRIGRRRETLVADGEALCEGVPFLRAEGIRVGRWPPPVRPGGRTAP